MKKFKLTTEHEKITGVPKDIWDIREYYENNER